MFSFIQEAVIKTISKKKKCKKAKWLSEEGLQTAEKRREAKGKGEKEIYTCLNADLQRIARRDKKAFLSDQDHLQEKEMQKGKMVIRGGFTSSWEKKKRCERQKRKGKI